MYIEAGIANNKDNISYEAPIEKYTVYVYFLDSLTEYEVIS
jgi:hypothetical protein